MPHTSNSLNVFGHSQTIDKPNVLLSAVGLVAAGQQGYKNIKKSLKSLSLKIILLLAAPTLKLTTFLLLRNMKRDIYKVTITPDNYGEYMEHYLMVQKKMRKVKPIDGKLIPQVPWQLRSVVADLKRIVDAGFDYQESLRIALGGPPKGLDVPFRSIEDLWKNRSKGYKYVA